MHTKKIYLAITVIILTSLACSFNFDLPITTDIKTGPTVTDDINIPVLGDPNATADVTLGFGAGELYLSPGADGTLIDGQATYNVDDFKPEISINDESIKIETGSLEIDGIPNFDDRVKNTWDLKLGTDPIDLTIKAGAYVGEFDLGDLSLSSLHISDGASEVDLNFAHTNRTEMQSLRYETGASNVTLRNLANANFSTMIFESGAGNYELDFSGQLQRDASVFIDTGLSTMTISVPDNMNVTLSVEGGLSNVTSRGTWNQSGNQFTISGDGPTLTITVEMNAGNLILNNP
jgi:hypothetical protein